MTNKNINIGPQDNDEESGLGKEWVKSKAAIEINENIHVIIYIYIYIYDKFSIIPKYNANH